MSVEDPPETPRLYLIPESESQELTALHHTWKQERAAALAVLLEGFNKETIAAILETVLELESIQTRYSDQRTLHWRRSVQVAYERGQKDGIGDLALMEDVATGKTDPENGPPPTPPDTLH